MPPALCTELFMKATLAHALSGALLTRLGPIRGEEATDEVDGFIT